MMEFDPWHLWLIAGIALFIFEIFVPGFILGCLGIGAFITSLVSFFDVSMETQLLVFAIVSIISFFTIRPLALKTLSSGDVLKTNVDSLIGKTARVSLAFDPNERKGRVKIDGDDWMAYTQEAISLDKGAFVEIVKVDSNTLIVKPKTV